MATDSDILAVRLATAGAGVAFILAALGFWFVNYGLAAGCFLGAVFLIIAARQIEIIGKIHFAWPFKIYLTREPDLWHGFYISMIGALILSCVTALPIAGGWLAEKSPLSTETLPGFTGYAVIQLEDAAKLGRQHFFDFETPEGARASFYLAENNRFIFSVSDIHGENSSIDIPIGKGGVPLDKFLTLFCEIGETSDHAYLRVVVNGNEVAQRKLVGPIDLGSRDWGPVSGTGVLGEHGGAFSLFEGGVNFYSLPDDKIDALVQQARDTYHLKL
ncbi:MAG TPA: hypothetical protein VGR52_00850 [Stellaceae bacterium]|nr:hypothetical protein [Stellaceae bacterium]